MSISSITAAGAEFISTLENDIDNLAEQLGVKRQRRKAYTLACDRADTVFSCE